jgi:hypothetical protein
LAGKNYPCEMLDVTPPGILQKMYFIKSIRVERHCVDRKGPRKETARNARNAIYVQCTRTVHTFYHVRVHRERKISDITSGSHLALSSFRPLDGIQGQ